MVLEPSGVPVGGQMTLPGDQTIEKRTIFESSVGSLPGRADSVFGRAEKHVLGMKILKNVQFRGLPGDQNNEQCTVWGPQGILLTLCNVCPLVPWSRPSNLGPGALPGALPTYRPDLLSETLLYLGSTF